EAALRTVKQQLEGVKLEPVDFEACRGMAGVKEAEIELAGAKIWIAITSSMSAAKPLLDEVRAGTSKYTFIEVMGCPGGCINGGGQPIVSPTEREDIDVKALRAKALYSEDAGKSVRKSHESLAIQKLYDEYFGQPNSHKAHELLHTHYTKREKY
ncbi:MAG: iron hydrogenase small subunit, partial [Clostridia bacterium]|nr:iron hydrogenase small subunit [Clostridia bacterium]